MKVEEGGPKEEGAGLTKWTQQGAVGTSPSTKSSLGVQTATITYRAGPSTYLSL